MKSVPDLQPVSPETDIAERSARTPGVQPERKNALFRRAELAGPGQNTATIDPNRYPKSLAILQSQSLGSKFGCPVKRNGSSGTELFAHPGRRDSRDLNFRESRHKSFSV